MTGEEKVKLGKLRGGRFTQVIKDKKKYTRKKKHKGKQEWFYLIMILNLI